MLLSCFMGALMGFTGGYLLGCRLKLISILFRVVVIVSTLLGSLLGLCLMRADSWRIVLGLIGAAVFAFKFPLIITGALRDRYCVDDVSIDILGWLAVALYIFIMWGLTHLMGL